MSDFPSDIYEQREIENLNGLVFDPAEKKILFAEDIQALGGEITAIEETLGVDPQGAFDTVVERLDDIDTRLDDAVEYGTFTPTLSFVTPGDLSGAYTVQSGLYIRVGNMLTITIRVKRTLTYTTASGDVIVGGMPFTPVNPQFSFEVPYVTGVTIPSGVFNFVTSLDSANNRMAFLGQRSVSAGLNITTTHLPTGTVASFNFTMTYQIT